MEQIWCAILFLAGINFGVLAVLCLFLKKYHLMIDLFFKLDRTLDRLYYELTKKK